VLQWSPLLIPFIVFILAFKSWEKRGRDPKEGSYVVRYEPVEGTSPAELGTLVDNRADMEDITATLVDLAVQGFIRIEEVTQSHLLGLSKSTDYIIHIIRKRSEWTALKPHEQRYLEALSSAAPTDAYTVKVSELRSRFYTSLPKIRDAIYDSLVSSGYYLQRPDKVKGKWVGLAVLHRVRRRRPRRARHEADVGDDLARRAHRRRRHEHAHPVRVRADHARPHHRRRPRPRSHTRLQGIPRQSGRASAIAR